MELDKDLAARQEARELCRRAEQAQRKLAQMSQAQLDAIVEAVAKAFSAAAVELAELAAKDRSGSLIENRYFISGIDYQP